MYKKINYLYAFVVALFLLIIVSGCTTTNQEFEYTSGGAYFERPSFVEKGKYQSVLTTQIDGGVFHVMTDDEGVADNFVNAQLDLLSFLEKKGVELRDLNYYVSDYDDTFSDSTNDAAYIGLTSAKTYKQVLVTLQTLWGEYTDYGYLYALSNEIAKELKWDTDSVQSIDELSMNNFFIENPEALNLLYPCFSIDYASQETIDNCKALSLLHIEDFKLKQMLSKSIDEQVDNFRTKSDEYAQELQVEFVRNECKYAYNGEYMPLKILTTYAEFWIDVNYEDRADYLKGLYTDYKAIFEASSIIESELNAAVAKFCLADDVDIVTFRCLSSESANYIHGKELINFYTNSSEEVTLTFLNAYYHEYHHYLSYVINPALEYVWQSEAFCELGKYYSYYGRLNVEQGFMQQEKWRDLFLSFAGHEYQSRRADYYELYDILCYACDDYELHWNTGRNPINSITGYLVDLYGEDAVINLYLYPDTVFDVTGKEWDLIICEWKQYIKERYKGCEIPEWVHEENN